MSVFVENCQDKLLHCKKRKKYHTKYNEKYRKLYKWSQASSKGVFFAFCVVCRVNISIKAVGAKGLRDHEATCRHSQRSREAALNSADNFASYHLNQNSKISNQQNGVFHVSHGIVVDAGCEQAENKPSQFKNIHEHDSQLLMPSSFQPVNNLVQNDVALLASSSYSTIDVFRHPVVSEEEMAIHTPLPSNPLSEDRFGSKQDLFSVNQSHSLADESTVDLGTRITHMSGYDISENPLVTPKNNQQSETMYNIPTSGLESAVKYDTKPNCSVATQMSEMTADDLTCTICNATFVQWKELKAHLVKHVQEAEAQKCKLLSQEQTQKRGRISKRAFKKEQQQCFVSHSDSDLRSKMEREDSLLPSNSALNFGESQTDQSQISSQASSESLSENIALGNAVPNSCHIQRKRSVSRKSSNLQCRVCRLICSDKSELKKHYASDHNNGKPYWCESCDRYFSTNNNLEVHKMHKHSSQTNHCLCSICNKVLSSKTNLKIHMMIHSGEKPYECPECRKKFNRKANLEAHLVYHKGERRFICEICGHSFFAINALQRHKKLHSGSRDFKCDVCSCSYVTSSDLRRHLLKHLNVKPFPCTLCDKQFTRSHDLKVHMRYHNKEVRFSCVVCEKSFVESGNYKKHMRKHTGERPYKCDRCSLTFSQAHHLKNHFRTNHGDGAVQASASENYKTQMSYPRVDSFKNPESYVSAHPGPVGSAVSSQRESDAASNPVSTDISVSLITLNPASSSLNTTHSSVMCETNTTHVHTNSSSRVQTSVHPTQLMIDDSHFQSLPQCPPTVIQGTLIEPHSACLLSDNQGDPSGVSEAPRDSTNSHNPPNVIQYNHYLCNNNALSPYSSLFDMCSQ